MCAYAFRSRFSHVPGALVHMLSHSSLEYSGAASRDQKDGCIKEGATTEEMWENGALRRDRNTQKCPNSAGSVSANQTLTAPPRTHSIPFCYSLYISSVKISFSCKRKQRRKLQFPPQLHRAESHLSHYSKTSEFFKKPAELD